MSSDKQADKKDSHISDDTTQPKSEKVLGNDNKETQKSLLLI